MGKFWVNKIDDIEKYLSDRQREKLIDISDTIAQGRFDDGKNPYNKYVIINLDEPYADEVLEIVKKHGHWEG